jgi:hypothetical protein
VHGQQLARLEDQLFRSLGELEEVSHSAGTAAELDDVTALHGGRSDLDVEDQRGTAEGSVDHRVSPSGAERPGAEWHEQSHAS